MRRKFTTATALPFAIALSIVAGTSAEAQGTLTPRTRTTGATCSSTDGKTECKCGKFDCVGLATTCKCLTSPQPKSSGPASGSKLSN